MRWTSLGHAGWLVEADGLGLLIDPVLGDSHHDDVFEVFPRRRVHAESLPARIVVVTHKHPDHFDVPSLARLARADPERALVTPDPLVERVARKLGFKWVTRMAAREHVVLEGVHLLTTPSWSNVVEWGLMVGASSGVAWNQVDTDLRSPADVGNVLRLAASRLKRPKLANGPELGIVRWNPIRQVEGTTGGLASFPANAYASELNRAAATAARVVIPGACGTRFIGPAAWRNRSVYPVTEARFLADIARRNPTSKGFPLIPGHRWRVVGGDCVPDGTADDLVELLEGADDRFFDPTSQPDLVDPNPRGENVAKLRSFVTTWVTDVLRQALGASWPTFGADRPLKLALEVVWPATSDAWTLRVDAGGATLVPGLDPDYDLLNRVAGSVLVDVLKGRSPWGRALLGGWLRVSDRCWLPTDDGFERTRVPMVFLYCALPYDRSQERWVDHQLSELGVNG